LYLSVSQLLANVHANRPYNSFPGGILPLLTAISHNDRVDDTAATCKTGVCESGGYVHLTSSSGFLASPAGSLSGCGSPSCPWVLSPPRGQRFNLTFYNFVQIDTNRQHHHQQQQQQQQASYSRYLTTAAASSFYSSLYPRLLR